MMIICSLVEIIAIHTHIYKKTKKKNKRHSLYKQCIHYNPHVHTIIDYNDVYAVYH